MNPEDHNNQPSDQPQVAAQDPIPTPPQPGTQVTPQPGQVTAVADQPSPAQAQPTMAQPQQPATEAQNLHTSGSKSKLPFIIIGVIAALAVVGGVIFAFIGSDGDNPNSPEAVARDVERRRDIAIFLTNVGLYQSNNNGKVPSLSQVQNELVDDYILDQGTTEFVDPKSEQPYAIVDREPALGEIQYATESDCTIEDEITAGKPREIAVRTLLESGDFHCNSL